MYEASLKAQAVLPGIDVQIIDYRWPEAHRGIERDSAHVLSLSLSPVPHSSCGQLDGGTAEALGDVVFVPAHTYLDARCDGGVQRTIRCRFSESRFARLTGHDGRWSCGELARSLTLADGGLRAGMKRLESELVTPGFGSEVVMESLANLLAMDLMRNLGRENWSGRDIVARGGLAPAQLRRIEDRLADPGREIPTVAELASLTGISARHLLRGFRQTTGITLRAHLQEASRARAAKLLETTDLSIKTIASLLGFRLQASFSTAFRNATGESPREYRARRR